MTINRNALMFNYMVEHESPRLDVIFQALADPTRRAMLARLQRGERTIGELAEPLAMSFAGASKHVKTLERAGLVQRHVRGRSHVLRLAPEPLVEAGGWLQPYLDYWSGSLDALEAAIIADAEEKYGKAR
ncbi:MAG: ArsR/SmtB family transcription factor [Sphingomonadaceae bacterium]